jgi:ribonuclease-3
VVGDEVLGTGTGRSKKEAEQQAAELAWRTLTGRAASTIDLDEESTSASGSSTFSAISDGSDGSDASDLDLDAAAGSPS